MWCSNQDQVGFVLAKQMTNMTGGPLIAVIWHHWHAKLILIESGRLLAYAA